MSIVAIGVVAERAVVALRERDVVVVPARFDVAARETIPERDFAACCGVAVRVIMRDAADFCCARCCVLLAVRADIDLFCAAVVPVRFTTLPAVLLDICLVVLRSRDCVDFSDAPIFTVLDTGRDD